MAFRSMSQGFRLVRFSVILQFRKESLSAKMVFQFCFRSIDPFRGCPQEPFHPLARLIDLVEQRLYSHGPGFEHVLRVLQELPHHAAGRRH